MFLLGHARASSFTGRTVRAQSSKYTPRRVDSKGSVNAAGAAAGTPNLWERGAPNTKSEGQTTASKPKQKLRPKAAAAAADAATPSTVKTRASAAQSAGKSAPPAPRGTLEKNASSPAVRKTNATNERSTAPKPPTAATPTRYQSRRPPRLQQPSDEQRSANFCISPVVSRKRLEMASPGRKAAVPLLNPRKNTYAREMRNNTDRGRGSPRQWDNKGGSWDKGRGGGRGRGRGRSGGRGPPGGRHNGRGRGRGRGRKHHTPLVADRDAVLPTWWIVSQKGTIKVRKSPNTRSPMVGNMPRGTKCRVVGSKQMEYQGKAYTRLHVKGRGSDAMSGEETEIEGWVTEVLFNGKVILVHTHTHIHTYIHTCMHAYIHTYIHTCQSISSQILLVKEQSNKWSRDTFQQEQQTVMVVLMVTLCFIGDNCLCVGCIVSINVQALIKAFI